MSCVSAEERGILVDMIAQAVVDRIEERDQVNRLADVVVARVLALQAEERDLKKQNDDLQGDIS